MAAPFRVSDKVKASLKFLSVHSTFPLPSHTMLISKRKCLSIFMVQTAVVSLLETFFAIPSLVKCIFISVGLHLQDCRSNRNEKLKDFATFLYDSFVSKATQGLGNLPEKF